MWFRVQGNTTGVSVFTYMVGLIKIMVSIKKKPKGDYNIILYWVL